MHPVESRATGGSREGPVFGGPRGPHVLLRGDGGRHGPPHPRSAQGEENQEAMTAVERTNALEE